MWVLHSAMAATNVTCITFVFHRRLWAPQRYPMCPATQMTCTATHHPQPRYVTHMLSAFVRLHIPSRTVSFLLYIECEHSSLGCRWHLLFPPPCACRRFRCQACAPYATWACGVWHHLFPPPPFSFVWCLEPLFLTVHLVLTCFPTAQ